MELTLGEDEWLSGDNITFAYFTIAPYIMRFSWLRMNELQEKNRPNITNWFTRIKDRLSYKKAITDVIDRESIDVLNKYGSIVWPTIRVMLNEV